ncbi:MAG: SGNH/GDSL hydrolase family protein, partial [Myxococcales bacterium]|nr:SGNH/GDSL hydrolase family protein [Myxococcales bacterium]
MHVARAFAPLVAAALLAVVGLPRCASAQALAHALVASPRLVVLAGDSITEGVLEDATLAIPASAKPAERVCWQRLCFAEQVRDGLERAASEGRIAPTELVNRGIGGATSRDWDPRDYAVDDVHYLFNGTIYGPQPLFRNIPAADVVVHYVGTNDAVAFFEAGPPLEAEEYAEHLVRFAATLRARGVEHVLLAVPPVPPAWSALAQGERMRDYGEAVRRACRALVAPARLDRCLLDLARDFPSDGFAPGAIHPTAAGHAFIARRYVEALVGVLREEGAPEAAARPRSSASGR